MSPHAPARRTRLWAIPFVAMMLAVVTACSPAAASIEVTSSTTVLDVRTPSEYAAGHLEGAQNLDVSSADFAANLEALDPDADYVVYCQSGNRSARAVAQMEDAGFTAVQDAGGISAASSATGLPIVD